MAEKLVGLTLTVEEIRASHARQSENLPPGSLGLLSPCRCPCCDPAFHSEQPTTTEKKARRLSL